MNSQAEQITNYNIKKFYDKKAIEEYNAKYYDNLYDSLSNVVIDTSTIVNIEILQFKVENDYYICLTEFIEDFNHLVSHLKNLTIYNHPFFADKLTLFQTEMLTKVNLVFPYNHFTSMLMKDIKHILLNNNLPKRDENSNYKNIPVAKSYEVIDNYYHVIPEITKDKMKTPIEPSCAITEEKCCYSYSELGPHCLERGSWNSKCIDRKMNIECKPDACGCDQDLCKNQALRSRRYLELGKDVIEKYSWGIDLYTFRNLMNFLPSNFDEKFKSVFIEKKVLPELSNHEKEGWDLSLALASLAAKIERVENKTEIQINYHFLASHLLKMYHKVPSTKQSFTAFCKGIGIFCNIEQGIEPHQLIAPYFGEIYPQWYWFEKQDLIKSKSLDKELPDFYNIQLERLKSDPRGYDILMVDPNTKGNFTSRMSHCCLPNCQTVTMISNNEYVIGMYSVQTIDFGEELTFDYNSITESENEYKEAICLCGSYSCRGHYLLFYNGKNHNEVVTINHSFLQRNALLLQSSLGMSNEYEETQIKLYLSESYIGECILCDCPSWLIKWAYCIAKYYNFEFEMMPMIQYLRENGKSILIETKEQLQNSCVKLFEVIESKSKQNDTTGQDSDLTNTGLEAEPDFKTPNEIISIINKKYLYFSQGLRDSRMQNMAITIDKVKHVLLLSKLKYEEPPLILALPSEILKFFWSEEEGSLKQTLSYNLGNLKDKGSQDLNKLISNLISELNAELSHETEQENLQEARQNLQSVAKLLMACSKQSSSISLAAFEPMSDIVYLYSCIEVFFKHNPSYQTPCDSTSISILQRDLNTTSIANESGVMSKEDLNQVIAHGNRKYDKQYVWGQLNGWFKQTVNKPDASLSAERRGCLVYPDLDCFFLSNINKTSKEISVVLDCNPDDIECANAQVQEIQIYSTRKNKHNKYVKTGVSQNDIVFNYPVGKDRRGFFEKLCSNPSMNWPATNRWTYKNKFKLYGTVQFDSVLKTLRLSQDLSFESSNDNLHLETVIAKLLELN